MLWLSSRLRPVWCAPPGAPVRCWPPVAIASGNVCLVSYPFFVFGDLPPLARFFVSPTARPPEAPTPRCPRRALHSTLHPRTHMYICLFAYRKQDFQGNNREALVHDPNGPISPSRSDCLPLRTLPVFLFTRLGRLQRFWSKRTRPCWRRGLAWRREKEPGRNGRSRFFFFLSCGGCYPPRRY